MLRDAKISVGVVFAKNPALRGSGYLPPGLVRNSTLPDVLLRIPPHLHLRWCFSLTAITQAVYTTETGESCVAGEKHQQRHKT